MDRASRLHADQTGWRRCTLRIRARPQGCRGIEFRIFALRKAKYCSLHCSECILIFSLRHFELRPCICRTLFVLIYRPSGVRGRTYFDGRHSHERTLHPMYTLYSMQRSGNSYKVRLALARLGIPYKLVEIDILKGESRTPEFLTKNPNGQVPLLEVAPNRHLAESNAILWHLVSRTPLRPEHRIDRNIGAAYFWLALVKGGRELQQHALEDWMEEGYRSLAVMENHLKHHRYFVGDRYSVADIALYAYAHLAHACDYELTTFPEIRAWLERVAAQPGYVSMDWQPKNVVAAE